MRNPNDRRHPHPTSLYPVGIIGAEPGNTERRRMRDRRIENLTLEERQLLLSEMPSLKPPKTD